MKMPEMKLFEWWGRVSPREQRLVIITGVMVAAAAGYFGYVQATDRIAAMDASIGGLEQDLVFYTEQMQLLDEVDRAYQAVATEHSSEWTQEEIHDRLRREVTRLSLVDPPPPNAAVSLSGMGQRLVEIRQMPQGSLTASESGYREYQITIRTQPTSIENITKFLERLHQSPQALRIASLELTRPPTGDLVTARITIIRSVIDTEAPVQSTVERAPTENWILNSGFEDWRDEQTPASWTLERATAAIGKEGVIEGERAALVTATEAGAALYQRVQLTAGTAYELTFTLKSEGPVRVSAYAESTSTYLDNAMAIDPQANAYQYRIRLTVPGVDGDPVNMRAPVFLMDNPGTKFTLDNVVLKELGA